MINSHSFADYTSSAHEEIDLHILINIRSIQPPHAPMQPQMHRSKQQTFHATISAAAAGSISIHHHCLSLHNFNIKLCPYWNFNDTQTRLQEFTTCIYMMLILISASFLIGRRCLQQVSIRTEGYLPFLFSILLSSCSFMLCCINLSMWFL